MKTNVPDVYAAGDIVVFPLATFGDQIANIQHWQMALKHGTSIFAEAPFKCDLEIALFKGQIAAKSIVGQPEALHSVPFFWTVLFGKSLRYTGKMSEMDFRLIYTC